MPIRDRRLRLRPRRHARHRAGLWTENLEARYLLVAPPINVAAGLTIATGLPLPGLATGQGLSTTAQSLPSSAVSVAPASVAADPTVTLATATATGPATTLSPLMNDSETANATASETARPTPGRSDRVQSLIETPEAVPVHLRVPGTGPIEVFPGPEIEVAPPAPAPVDQAPAPVPARLPVAPELPVRSPEIAPVPLAEAAPAPTRDAIALQVWDAALALIAPEPEADAPALLTTQTETGLAAGVLLAAWGGWKYGPQGKGRSRRNSRAILVVKGEEAAASR